MSLLIEPFAHEGKLFEERDNVVVDYLLVVASEEEAGSVSVLDSTNNHDHARAVGLAPTSSAAEEDVTGATVGGVYRVPELHLLLLKVDVYV